MVVWYEKNSIELCTCEEISIELFSFDEISLEYLTLRILVLGCLV